MTGDGCLRHPSPLYEQLLLKHFALLNVIFPKKIWSAQVLRLWLLDFRLRLFKLLISFYSSLFQKKSWILLSYCWLLSKQKNLESSVKRVISQNKRIQHLFNDKLFKQHGFNTCRLHSYLLVTVENESDRIIINLFSNRFTNRQAENVLGISSSAKVLRKRRNLVSMRFNMINWLLETVSLILFLIKNNVFLTILYVLVNSCGTPLVILFKLFWIFHSFTIFFWSTFSELRKTGSLPGSISSHT